MSDPNGTSIEGWGEVLDCTSRFAERTAKALKEQAKREKQRKAVEQYKPKDPNKPPEPVPDSERLVTVEMWKGFADAADKNMRMVATDLDKVRDCHNAWVKYASSLHGMIGKLFALNHNLVVELSKANINMTTAKKHFYQAYTEIKSELEGDNGIQA